MIELLENLEKRYIPREDSDPFFGEELSHSYYFSSFEGRSFILLVFPFLPFEDNGGAIVDGYYPVSNRAYKFTKFLSEELNKEGVPNVFAPKVNYKALLLCSDSKFFVGKNTLCYHEDFGSRFCIEVIELIGNHAGVKEVQPRSCSDCGACKSSCPTGAIVDGGFIRGKCLRELMNAQDYSDETMNLIGRRLYGCDICQRVCPHNSKKERKNPKGEFLKYENLLPACSLGKNLEPLRALVGDNYLRPRKILKLALIGAGNSGNPDLLPLVSKYLNHEDETVEKYAERAVKLLNKSGGSK